MLKFEVRNFRGIALAEGECNPIALVGGLNGAGKTSLAQAVGAVMAGRAQPVQGLGRSANVGGQLVRIGASDARITVTGPEGAVSLHWPNGETSTTGKAPYASPFAVGLESIAGLTPKERAPVLSQYLRADPTRDDLAEAMIATGFDEASVGPVWELIEKQGGFEAAHQLRRDRGAELKHEWRLITGANYGTKVAEHWRPDLLEGTEADLSLAVSNAKREHEDAIAAAAVSADEKRRLEEEAAALPREKELLAEAQQLAEGRKTTYDQAVAHRQSLPPAERVQAQPCPYPECGRPIVVEQISLVERRLVKAPPETDDKDAKSRRLAIAGADGAQAHANDELMQARAALVRCQQAVETGEAAVQRLAAWPRAVPTGADPQIAATALARAEDRLADWRRKREADAVHRRIENNERIIQILAGDGLRKQKLERVLEAFGRMLAGLCTVAGWGEVTIDFDMTLRYDGRPYSLLSTSEQYRVRAVLQAVMARLDGSQMLIFDGADILDAPSRPGLANLIEATDLPGLICMTLARPQQAPDLQTAGYGRTYWLSGGTLQPLVAEKAA